MIPPVVVGSASRDLSGDDPRGWRLGGAAAYCGLTLARLGMRPRVLIGVDATAATADELDLLRDAGAEVSLVPLATGPIFRNRPTPAGRIQDCIEPGEPLPVSLPARWVDGEAWLLVPVADEILPAWAALPSPDAFVAIGWQGLLRNLVRGEVVTRRPPRRGALIERAGLVVLSREDLDPGTDIDALAALLRPPARLVVTDAEAGGTIWELAAGGGRRVRRYPAIPSSHVIDPTGAGDAFLASLVAGRLGHRLAGSVRRGTDVRLAAAVASLTVEGPGLRGIPDLGAVAARLRSSVGAVYGEGTALPRGAGD